MIGYIVRRLGTSIVVLIGVSFFIFALLHAIYPSPGIDVLGSRANAVTLAAWNKQNGFDDPWLVQYLRYVGHLFQGNLGYSYKLNQSVASLVGEVWARSAWLSGASLVLSVVIAFPLGIYQAVRRNTVGDYTVTTISFALYAMPAFLLGLILIQVFGLDLHWFSYEGSQATSLPKIIVDRKSVV